MSEKYLFTWDNIPTEQEKNIEEENKLLNYLKDDCNINWIEGAKIRRSEDDKTICIHKGDKSVEMVIDENGEKAILDVGYGTTYDLKIKRANSEMRIYWRSAIFECNPEKPKLISGMGLGYTQEPVAYSR